MTVAGSRWTSSIIPQVDTNGSHLKAVLRFSRFRLSLSPFPVTGTRTRFAEEELKLSGLIRRFADWLTFHTRLLRHTETKATGQTETSRADIKDDTDSWQYGHVPPTAQGRNYSNRLDWCMCQNECINMGWFIYRAEAFLYFNSSKMNECYRRKRELACRDACTRVY